jgi:RNA polymerase sigma factor (sigma-70 family)
MSGRTTVSRPPLGEAGRALVTEHLWLADAIAREFAWLRPKTVDGDVSQPAYEGLVKAATGFDPACGAFVSYARKWVIGEIFRAVDDKTPGFSRRYAPALDLFGDLDEEGPGEVADEALDHAAAVLCIAGESLRRAREEPSGMECVVSEELAALPERKRGLLLGWALGEGTWEELAQPAGVSVSTAKRWVEQARVTLVERLSGRRERKDPDARPR